MLPEEELLLLDVDPLLDEELVFPLDVLVLLELELSPELELDPPPLLEQLRARTNRHAPVPTSKRKDWFSMRTSTPFEKSDGQ